LHDQFKKEKTPYEKTVDRLAQYLETLWMIY
jgi:hypothetical protein